MKRFVAGADRMQSTLLPESLDDWVDESNPVRVIDAFVDALNVRSLALTGSSRRRRGGRPIILHHS
jgi:transposase